jgi:hypothetical protein
MKYAELPDGTIFFQIPEHELTHFFWELNPDKSEANFTYVSSMVKLIYQHRKKSIPFTPKQYQWILSKIRFILKRNKHLGLSKKSVTSFEIV